MDIISILIITKGHNSINIAHGVTVLIFLTLSDRKFGENILNGLRVMEQTRSQCSHSFFLFAGFYTPYQ